MDYHFDSVVKIDQKEIGITKPCYIVAEIGVNHNGKIDLAKKLVDVACEAGADAVKFQKRSLTSLYNEDVLNNPNVDSQGLEILLDFLKEVELTDSEYSEIITYCQEKGISFLCTPWDRPSVDFLERFNVPAYKIASADLTNLPLIKYIAKTGKPIIISTGMSTIEEIEDTVDFVKKQNIPFILLHSNSTYPAPVESLNLSLIPFLRTKFNVPVGYSGHEASFMPTVVAANLGAVMVERHITLDKKMEGLDQAASLEPNEFKTLVKYIRESEIAKGQPIKKITRGEFLQREILAKSIICISDIKEGDIFSEYNIDVRGPARGLSPQHYFKILGKKSSRNIKKGQYLLDVDLN